MGIHLIRHGPKNNDPAVHGTGVEALLDPVKMYQILGYATRFLEEIDCEKIKKISVESTPVERAYVTSQLIAAVISLDPRLPSVSSGIQELIGSYAIHPTSGEAVCLSPLTMTRMWAKKKEISAQSEHRPLYSWCEQGFDNPQVNSAEDHGISLREIACRLGSYVWEKIEQSDEKSSTIAIGHSGDIEPFLYLTLEMLEGRDGKNHDAMVSWFHRTSGALEPLKGIKIYEKEKGNYYLLHPVGRPDAQREGEIIAKEKPISIEIFQQQAQWFKEYGKSADVLKKKMRVK